MHSVIYIIEQNPKLGTCCLKIIELHSWKEALKLWYVKILHPHTDTYIFLKFKGVGTCSYIYTYTHIYGEGTGNPLQFSCLKNSTHRGAWWAIVHRVAKESDTTEQLTHTHTYIYIYIHTCMYMYTHKHRYTHTEDVRGCIWVFYFVVVYSWKVLITFPCRTVLEFPCCCSVAKSCPTLWDPFNYSAISREIGTFITTDGNAKWYSHFGKPCVSSLNN